MDTNTQQLRVPVRLVATNSLWVAGFQGLFGDPCGVEIVAVSVNQALGLKEPEVVLIDSGSFRVSGSLREVLARFRQTCPEVRLIVVGTDSGSDGEEDSDADSLYIQRLIQAGARGFLRPSARPHEFSAALHWVRRGSIWAPRQVLSRLVQSSQTVRNFRHNPNHLDTGQNENVQAKVRFTPREDQVLRLLVGGQCNRDIGHSLGIAPFTVKAHLSRLMRKAGVANRVELTMYALDGRIPTLSMPKTRTVVPINSLYTPHSAEGSSSQHRPFDC